MPHGRGSVFHDDHNRNKRAIGLDLTLAEGRQVMYDMMRKAPPAFAEHTEEVLQEVCGYSWDRISELKEKGVI